VPPATSKPPEPALPTVVNAPVPLVATPAQLASTVAGLPPPAVTQPTPQVVAQSLPQASPQTSTQPPLTAASAAVPVPPVQPTSAANTDPSPAYKSQLTAAAQAAFQVPGTVVALSFKGRTRVGFKLTDQTVSGVTLVQSSGLGAMDRAALAAVQTAQYPKAPAELRDRLLAFEIWVSHAPAN
jgi:periplasmic protein TonB